MTEIIFVNKLLLLVSISQGMSFTTIEYLSSKTDITLVSSTNKIVSYYKKHALHVGMICVDPKFQFLEENLVSIALDTTGARDHVT